jgi:hypothetical protein
VPRHLCRKTSIPDWSARSQGCFRDEARAAKTPSRSSGDDSGVINDHVLVLREPEEGQDSLVILFDEQPLYIMCQVEEMDFGD